MVVVVVVVALKATVMAAVMGFGGGVIGDSDCDVLCQPSQNKI
jgi:hypothetical protein